MRHSPHEVYEHLKETICSYLDTAYRISHPLVAAERAALLRKEGVVTQLPYVETTPKFKSGQRLCDLEHPWLPEELTNLLAQSKHPLVKHPLHLHQQQALEAAWADDGTPRNLIVATGTGSGKTECFYLPILADILREAKDWKQPKGEAKEGFYHNGKWLHRRRHETRPAALRAIVLYPMNALVNDQLRRLRRTLASDEALAWQHQHLNGNYIYFGCYTSQTVVPGSPLDKKRRDRWRTYQQQVVADWNCLDEELRRTGGWPRLDGSEMLCRWNMQEAPPDILVTNYSMLEYMLVRPIEASIFEKTREWLAESKEHVLTLVLDEAHSYSGARGTEVAYLIRRLYERLEVGPEQVRCVATSATLGEGEEALRRVRTFAAELFGHDEKRFTVIKAKTEEAKTPTAPPTEETLRAFVDFQRAFAKADEPQPAIDVFLNDLGISSDGGTPAERLFNALEHHPQLLHLREVTAWHARALEEVADTLWGNLATPEERLDATAGLLAVGAYARKGGEADADVPPLLPSRLHLMYRGLPGLWACMNPNCSAVEEKFRGDRPFGKLYAEPRVWCECGAKVLEVFSCHVCGLLYLGGVPDKRGWLWPYEADLEGGLQNYEKYRLFIAENPNNDQYDEQWRSVYTTEPDPADSSAARMVWVEPGRKTDGKESPFPIACPRCNAGRNPFTGREIIEPLRTKGHQSFAVLIEDAFRLQPKQTSKKVKEKATEAAKKTSGGWFKKAATIVQTQVQPPEEINEGRKLLTFSDGRQDAAILAGDLEWNHQRDAFRQLLVVALKKANAQGIPVPSLRKRLFDIAVGRGIDPTFGEEEGFWGQLRSSTQAARDTASQYLDAFLRKEIVDRQIAVEPLGLARWIPVTADGESFENFLADMPPISPLDASDTLSLIYIVTRILASENVLLPPSLNPEDWQQELVNFFERKVLHTQPQGDSQAFIWSSKRKNRLTRYLGAVADYLGFGKDGLATLMDKLLETYLKEMGILVSTTGPRAGLGIPLESLALAQMPEEAYVCTACGYVSAEAIGDICLRCQGTCRRDSTEKLRKDRIDYYRSLAHIAIGEYDALDPFPLRVREHTAQISVEEAAKRERYFQNQFIRGEEEPHALRVDVLSVTTTMEMGIDIGDLNAVGLRNMPPTVANHQQRAGRAGRRGDGVAAVLTYARHRSHDQYYFDRVRDIVSGDVRVPQLHLDNLVIAQRHVNALALQRFFRHRYDTPGADTGLFGALGTVGQFRDASDGPSQLQKALADKNFRPTLEKSLERVMPNMAAHIAEWLDVLPKKITEVISKAHPDEELLEVLITGGLLPRYAFPVDVVALWTREPTQWSQGEEVQRDLQIGLSEYAPGAEIVIDGKIYESAGLYTPYEDEPTYEPTGWYYECPRCQAVRFEPSQPSKEPPDWVACEICGEPILLKDPIKGVLRAIRPQGFCTDWWKKPKRYRGGGRERAGYSSRAQLHPGETAEDAGVQKYDNRLWVHCREGDLYVVNRGPDIIPGFSICPKCGRVVTKSGETHKRPTGSWKFGPKPGSNCSHKSNRVVLVHDFKSDVVLLGVNLPESMDADATDVVGRAAWYSLGTAILRASAAYLQIDPEELAVGIRPWRRPDGRLHDEVYLYDTLPNGAGYAKEVADNIDNILKEASSLCNHCYNPDCEGACYRCLMDYYNQRHHAQLNRFLAIDLIEYICEGRVPQLPRERQLKALLPLEHLLPPDYKMEKDIEVEGTWVPALLTPPQGEALVIWPMHTLRTISNEEREQIAFGTGFQPVFPREFDLIKRPVWVWDEVVSL